MPVMDEGTESSVGGNDSPKVTPVGKGSGDDNTGYRSESYSFDSTALERAAKAAKVNILSFYRLSLFNTAKILIGSVICNYLL